jgi:beta-glucanase (GH16 family)
LISILTPPLHKGGFPQIVFGATAGASDEATTLEDWELVWSDEFDGDTLDLKKWTPRANSSAPGKAVQVETS